MPDTTWMMSRNTTRQYSFYNKIKKTNNTMLQVPTNSIFESC